MHSMDRLEHFPCECVMFLYLAWVLLNLFAVFLKFLQISKRFNAFSQEGIHV